MATWPTFDDYKQLAQETVRALQRVVPLSNVTVACGLPGRGGPSRPFPAFIPGQGAGSYTHATAQDLNVPRGDSRVDGACIVVSLDVSWHPAEMRGKLPYLIAHEWHHAARILAGTWRDGTLVDAVIAEGLADHFAHECGTYDPPWCYAVEAEALPAWEQRAREEPEPYSHAKWFFGEGLPPWIGYALGYAVVGRYLLHRIITARESVKTESVAIWEPMPEYPLDLYALTARRHAAAARVRAYDGRLLNLVPREGVCRRG